MNLEPHNGVNSFEVPGQQDFVADLIERVGNIFAAPEYTPPMLPTVAIELLHVARYPDIDLKHIARLVAADPMLAGRVMSLVQSPAYAGKMPIRSLNQAVFRIGLNSLRDLVVQAALNMRLFTTQGYTTTMERVRLHSIATAHISRIIVRNMDKPHSVGEDCEIAFLDGLLHDVGIAATLIVIDDLYAGQQRPHLEAIWPAIHAVHESAGRLLARIWDLPNDLTQLIGHHHDLQQNQTIDSRVARLHFAEHIAAKLGRSIVPARPGNGHAQALDQIQNKQLNAAYKALKLNRETTMTMLTQSQEALGGFR